MISIEAYRDRSVAVFGLGASGLSAARALAAGGARVSAWDDGPDRRAEIEARLDDTIALAEPSPEAWADMAVLVLSPGVPLTHPRPHAAVRLARRLGIEVLGDVELFARTRPTACLVAITGTNGKSTTTALLGHILAQAGKRVEIGANLGRPVLDLNPLAADGAYVLELSSYQIDLTRSLRPAVAVLMNLSPDHLDRHGDMAGYVRAKRRLFEMAGADSLAVVGVDDADSRDIADWLGAVGRRLVPVAVGRALEDGIHVDDGVIYRARDGVSRPIASLAGIDSLLGAHNWQNAAVATAVALELGLDEAAIQDGLRSFPGLAHRMQRVAKVGGVVFVNDSKATNAEAAAHALAAYDRIHWIAGGLPKAGGIAGLADFFPKVEQAYLIGEAAGEFAQTLEGQVACQASGDLETAVRAAYRAASTAGGAGRVVLLSPACASFDQFTSFEARGEAFIALVDELAQRNCEAAP
ncbi:MAG: UDP-N-acetylmuramoyl-L-alanine--D-glutamate ligase [Alphaproteobacteria bacterium]|nr:UDP-N-acetylmuramoyl-L-alanine--D-glutamate ligase [Alphaproteobacteria bacterium]